MHALIDTHNAAIDHTDHFRCAMVVGAKSELYSGECETSSCSSTKSRCSPVRSMVAVVIGDLLKKTTETRRHGENTRKKPSSRFLLPLRVVLRVSVPPWFVFLRQSGKHSPRLMNLPS